MTALLRTLTAPTQRFARHGMRGTPTGPVYVDVWLVWDLMNNNAPAGAEVRDTWNGCMSYLRADPLVATGTARGRVWVEYTNQVWQSAWADFRINVGDGFESIEVWGQWGGPATAIDDTHIGDGTTEQWAWSTPEGVICPLGLGDFTVELNGQVLRPIRDYDIWWDAYTVPAWSTREYPTTTGQVRLIEWVWNGSQMVKQGRPLQVGETLRIRSKEARPLLETQGTAMFWLNGQAENPEGVSATKGDGQTVDTYAIRRLVMTSDVAGAQNNTITARNVIVEDCFGWGMDEFIAPQGTAYTNTSIFRGSLTVKNTSIFACSKVDTRHNIYTGAMGRMKFENVFSHDSGWHNTGSAHRGGSALKIKGKMDILIDNCTLADAYACDLMGFTAKQDGPPPISSITGIPTTIVTNTLLYRKGVTSGGGTYFITMQNRKGPNYRGGVQPPYGTRTVKDPTSFSIAENNLRHEVIGPADGTTTVFAWDALGPYGNNRERLPSQNSHFVVGVADSTEWPKRLSSTAYTVTYDGTPGEATTGTVDLSPTFTAAELNGKFVIVQTSVIPEQTDFWDPAFWSSFRLSNVLERYEGAAEGVDGVNKTFAWAVRPAEIGVTDNPETHDFHVTADGITRDGFTVEGAGTSSGTITFTGGAPTSYVIIATDGATHKTAYSRDGITPTHTDHPDTYDLGEVDWGLYPSDYKWPPVLGYFLSNNILICATPDTKALAKNEGTPPPAVDTAAWKYPLPVPDEWKERSRAFWWGNTYINCSPANGLTALNENQAGFQFNVPCDTLGNDTIDGIAPTVPHPAPPAWFKTVADFPADPYDPAP